MTTQRTEGARSKPAGEPCFDCLDEAIAADRPRPVEPREVAFWLIAYVFAATMLGTTLPTPLYVIWQSQWHFSSGVITLIFAVYAAGVLAALILAACLRPGRAPAGARGRSRVQHTQHRGVHCGCVCRVAFLGPGPVWLLRRPHDRHRDGGAHRHAGTGKATAGSLVATVANTGGLGLGPLIAGLFAQYLPRPTVLVFEVYLAFLAVAALAVAWVPETVPPRQRLTVRFAGFGIPDQGGTSSSRPGWRGSPLSACSGSSARSHRRSSAAYCTNTATLSPAQSCS